MYVLCRNVDGKMVAAPGQLHSYTTKIEAARIYPTIEAARLDACSNEYVKKIGR